MKIKVITPNDCTKEELADFCRLAIDGGQVNSRYLMNRIQKAKLLALGYVEKELVSISSIKVPDLGYKNGVFKSASIEGNGYNFKLNYELISKLDSCKVYATTANSGMIHLLNKLGFEVIGEKYKGEYNNDLQIYSLNIIKK